MLVSINKLDCENTAQLSIQFTFNASAHHLRNKGRKNSTNLGWYESGKNSAPWEGERLNLGIRPKPTTPADYWSCLVFGLQRRTASFVVPAELVRRSA